MTQEEVERAFLAYCMEMRLQGVHPDWFVIWTGANTLNQTFVEWLRGPSSIWPTDAHMHKPTKEVIYDHSYKTGLPKWNFLVEKYK